VARRNNAMPPAGEKLRSNTWVTLWRLARSVMTSVEQRVPYCWSLERMKAGASMRSFSSPTPVSGSSSSAGTRRSASASNRRLASSSTVPARAIASRVRALSAVTLGQGVSSPALDRP